MSHALPRRSRQAAFRFRPEVTQLEGRENPAGAFILSNNTLIGFDTSAPTTPTATLAVTGLKTGDTLVGIDARPQNGHLYGLGYNATAGTVQLYSLSPITGTAFSIGAAQTAGGTRIGADANTRFGFDFNPTVDRIRITTTTGQNLRMDPNNGVLTNVDTAVNGATTTIDSAAYSSNRQNATATTLYGINTASGALYSTAAANGGTYTLVGALGSGAIPADSGFDISTSFAGVDTAYAAFTVNNTPGLYTINLGTGAATLVGTFKAGTVIQGFTTLVDQVNGQDIPSVALTTEATQRLFRFNANSPATFTPVTIDTTNLTTGERLVGIDYRPAIWELYALGVNSTTNTGTLYIVDPQTGALARVGAAGGIALVTAGGTAVALPATGYGFNFNPAVDRIRVTTTTGLNFRINPNDGTVVDGNTTATGTQGDTNLAVATSGGGAAYTNSYAQVPSATATTTLYTIDPTTGTLYRSTNPNGGTSAAVGVLSVGATPVSFNGVNGFDIPALVQAGGLNAPASGFGFAALTDGSTVSLAKIDLLTAQTSLVSIGTGTTQFAGIALGITPGGAVQFSAPTYTVAEGGTTATLTVNRVGGFTGVLQFNLYVTGGSATPGADFTGPPTSFAIPDGQNTLTVTFPVKQDTTPEGAETITFALANPSGGSFLAAQQTATVTITDDDTGGSTVAPTFVRAVAFGTGSGVVNVYNADGSLRFANQPFAGFGGPISVATGDFNGDFVEDVIVGAGAGGDPRVTVLNGANGAVLANFFAFERGFTGGLSVAAGDINGDGLADAIIGAGPGGDPRVSAIQLFARSGATVSAVNTTLVNFFAYAQGLLGGITVASGDLDGDGRAEIVTGTRSGGGPEVRVFSPAGVLLRSFYATNASFTGGVDVAVGYRAGVPVIVTGNGAGGGALVGVFDATTLKSVNTFSAFLGSNSSLRVTVDAGTNKLVVAGGAGVRAFDIINFGLLEDTTPAPGFNGGIDVG